MLDQLKWDLLPKLGHDVDDLELVVMCEDWQERPRLCVHHLRTGKCSRRSQQRCRYDHHGLTLAQFGCKATWRSSSSCPQLVVLPYREALAQSRLVEAANGTTNGTRGHGGLTLTFLARIKFITLHGERLVWDADLREVWDTFRADGDGADADFGADATTGLVCSNEKIGSDDCEPLWSRACLLRPVMLALCEYVPASIAAWSATSRLVLAEMDDGTFNLWSRLWVGQGWFSEAASPPTLAAGYDFETRRLESITRADWLAAAGAATRLLGWARRQLPLGPAPPGARPASMLRGAACCTAPSATNAEQPWTHAPEANLPRLRSDAVSGFPVCPQLRNGPRPRLLFDVQQEHVTVAAVSAAGECHFWSTAVQRPLRVHVKRPVHTTAMSHEWLVCAGQRNNVVMLLEHDATPATLLTLKAHGSEDVGTIEALAHVPTLVNPWLRCSGGEGGGGGGETQSNDFVELPASSARFLALTQDGSLWAIDASAPYACRLPEATAAAAATNAGWSVQRREPTSLEQPCEQPLTLVALGPDKVVCGLDGDRLRLHHVSPAGDVTVTELSSLTPPAISEPNSSACSALCVVNEHLIASASCHDTFLRWWHLSPDSCTFCLDHFARDLAAAAAAEQPAPLLTMLRGEMLVVVRCGVSATLWCAGAALPILRVELKLPILQLTASADVAAAITADDAGGRSRHARHLKLVMLDPPATAETAPPSPSSPAGRGGSGSGSVGGRRRGPRLSTPKRKANAARSRLRRP